MPAPAPDPIGYRFDDIEIDLRRRELRAGGVLEALEPRVYELIVLLIEGRERAFSKDELIERLWGRPVSDASLSQLVYKARRSLREDDTRRFIETVHGHGFRWLAEVRPLGAKVVSLQPAARPLRAVTSEPDLAAPDAPAAKAPRAVAARAPMRVWWTGLLVAVAVLAAGALAMRYGLRAPASAAMREVLVLPLEDRTGEPALAWTHDGLTGLVVSVLDQMPGLAGVSGRDALGATAAAPDAAQRRRLRLAAGADQVASLHLSRAGPLLRLDLILEGESGQHSTALFGAEAAPLALDAAQRIGEWLGGASASKPAGGPDSYFAETYARGIEAFVNGRTEVARSHFAICVERRPDLAWPRLQLAAAEVRLGHNANALRLLADLEQRADALAPVQARHLRLRLADARLGAGDTEAARRGYEALQAEAEAAGDRLLLRLAWSGLGHAEAAMGRYEAAAPWLRRVVDFDRRNGDRRREALALADLAALAFLQGDLVAAEQGALQVGDLARQQDLPALQQRSLSNLAGIKHLQGQPVAALDLYRQALPLARQLGDIGAEAVIRTGLANVYAGFGRAASAERHARLALSLARNNGLSWEEAVALGASGRVAEAAGDGAQAQRLLAAAAERFEQTRNWPHAAMQRLRLAQEARLRGDAAALARQVERLDALAREHADVRDVRLLARAGRAQQQLALGDPAALTSLEQAVAEGAGSRWKRLLTIEVGRFALALGHLERAGAVLSELVATQSDDPEVLQLQRQWLLASGRGEEAAQVQARLDRLAESLPDEPEGEANAG